MSNTKSLLMPSSYAIMDEEEMTYLEGGYRASRSVYFQAGSKRMSVEEYMDTEYFCNKMASFFVGIASAGAGYLLKIPPAQSFLLGVASTLLSNLGGNSRKTAQKLDKADGKEDGMITISWNGFWQTEYNPYPPNSYEGAMF